MTNIRQAFESTKYITVLVQADVDLVAQSITISLTAHGVTQGPFAATWVGSSTNSGGVYSRSARYLRAANSVPRASYAVSYNLSDNPETGPDPVQGSLTIY